MRILGPAELFVIVIIIMALFGGKKFQELRCAFGRGFGGFKRDPYSMREGSDETPTTPKTS